MEKIHTSCPRKFTNLLQLVSNPGVKVIAELPCKSHKCPYCGRINRVRNLESARERMAELADVYVAEIPAEDFKKIQDWLGDKKADYIRVKGERGGLHTIAASQPTPHLPWQCVSPDEAIERLSAAQDRVTKGRAKFWTSSRGWKAIRKATGGKFRLISTVMKNASDAREILKENGIPVPELRETITYGSKHIVFTLTDDDTMGTLLKLLGRRYRHRTVKPKQESFGAAWRDIADAQPGSITYPWLKRDPVHDPWAEADCHILPI